MVYMMKIPGQLVNRLDNHNVNDSCGNVLFADQIDTVVRTAFPPITEAEYLMAPGAFNVRKKFSPENTPCNGNCFFLPQEIHHFPV